MVRGLRFPVSASCSVLRLELRGSVAHTSVFEVSDCSLTWLQSSSCSTADNTAKPPNPLPEQLCSHTLTETGPIRSQRLPLSLGRLIANRLQQLPQSCSMPRSAGLRLAREVAETPAGERGTWFDMCPGRGASTEDVLRSRFTGCLPFSGQNCSSAASTERWSIARASFVSGP